MMSDSSIKFPDDTGYFDDRTIIEVVSEYDFPLIYTFYSKTKDFFLAYFCENKEDESIWLFLPTDQARLRKLYRDEISISDFFRLSNCCYLVGIDNDTGLSKPNATHLTFNCIPKEYLPRANVLLGRKISELAIRVLKPGLNPFTATERLVSELIRDIRKSFRSIMQEIKDRVSDFSNISIPESIFSVPEIGVGSLELIIRPSDPTPLLERSIEIIGKVIAGLPDENIDEDLKSIVKKNILAFAPDSKRLYNFSSIEISGRLPTTNISISLTKTTTNKFREDTKNMEYRERTLVLKGKVTGFTPEFVELEELDENDCGLERIKCNFDLDELLESLESNLSLRVSQEELKKPGKLILHERVQITCDYIPKARYANMRGLLLLDNTPSNG
jgi:hypothetical protein